VTDKPSDGTEEEDLGAQSAFFMVEIKNPAPDGLKLSRKNVCFVEIRPQSQATDKAIEEQRAEMVKHFLQGDANEISWCYQFIQATMLGPTIDDEGAIDEVTGMEAVMHFL